MILPVDYFGMNLNRKYCNKNEKLPLIHKYAKNSMAKIG